MSAILKRYKIMKYTLLLILLLLSSCSKETIVAEQETISSLILLPEGNIPNIILGNTYYNETSILSNGTVVNSSSRIYYLFHDDSTYSKWSNQVPLTLIKIKWENDEFFQSTGAYRYSLVPLMRKGKKSNVVHLISRHMGNNKKKIDILIKVIN